MSFRLPARVYGAFAALASAGIVALVLSYPPDRLIGEMFAAEGDFDTAIQYFRSWTVRHPADYEARWTLAELMQKGAHAEQALDVLEEMAEDWPKDAKILARLVAVEDSLLHMQNVIPRLEALAALTPDDPKVLRRLADHYRWFGASEKLVQMLFRLERFGITPSEHRELVDILLANRRYDELIVFFEENVAQKPHAVAPHLALYQAYLRLFVRPGSCWSRRMKAMR